MSVRGSPNPAIEREFVHVPPDKTLFPKLGLGGYTIPQAIAELIDNAIDARIEGERLHIGVEIGSHAIAVTDDGSGMDADSLRNALRLAYSHKEGKLGEFGLGLKTACTSLGHQFEVTTSPEGHRKMYRIRYDEDEWTRTPEDQWLLPLEKEEKVDPRGHGTEVSVRRLKVKTAALVTRLRKDLSQRFAPYIASGDVEIKVNTKKCAPAKVELLEGTRKDFEIFVRGDRIWGWYGLLERGSQRGLYGFHTYRRGRMITTFDKIGIPEHPTSARITGEIHLDHVPVTHNKREFIRESDQYEEAVAALEAEFRELVKLARQTAVPDRITPTVRQKLSAWKDYLAEAMKSEEMAGYRLPAGVAFERVDPVEVPASGLEVIDIERRASPEAPSPDVPNSTDTRERVPRETHPEERHVIRIKGKRFEYKHDFRSLGLDAPWKEHSVDENRRLIEIYTNTDFPAYHTTQDVTFYAVLHIVESLAEIVVRRSEESLEKVAEVRETLLRISSRIANQVENS